MKCIRNLFPGGKSKTVTFSYDDGVNFDRRMIEILNSCGLKGTFNLNSGLLTEENCWPTKDGTEIIRRINRSEVAAVYEGHEVAIHGLTHPFWTAVPREQALYELLEDKKNLEKLVGYPVRGMAYPFFSYNDEIRTIAEAVGIRYARSANYEQYYQLPTDPLLFCPTCTHTDPYLMPKAKKFISETFNTNAIFCLFGHSFEFANDHNWDILEDFCDFISHRDEIWYASCIQIFDYIDAAKNLIFTSDCSIVHNPSATKVCLWVDGETVEIRPGETLRL